MGVTTVEENKTAMVVEEEEETAQATEETKGAAVADLQQTKG